MSVVWYGLVTNIKCESRAKRGLEEKGFPTYLPRFKEERRHKRTGEWRVVDRLMLPRYLFVIARGTAQDWLAIRTTDVVETWRLRGEERPTLCFAVDRAHAKHLQARFEEAGVPTGYIDAFTDTDERAVIRRRFHAGEIKVVCNVGCLTMGVDWDVRCIILARPTKSEMLFVQIIGRGLRTAPGKDALLVLDHSDTHQRLGFVTDIHHEALDTGKAPTKSTRPEKVRPLPKECPRCTFLKPAKVATCPACGFKPEVPVAVEVEKGELVELERRQIAGMGKREIFGQLRWIARERGYSEGWCAHKFREFTGVWPNHYMDERSMARLRRERLERDMMVARQVNYPHLAEMGRRHSVLYGSMLVDDDYLRNCIPSRASLFGSRAADDGQSARLNRLLREAGESENAERAAKNGDRSPLTGVVDWVNSKLWTGWDEG